MAISATEVAKGAMTTETVFILCTSTTAKDAKVFTDKNFTAIAVENMATFLIRIEAKLSALGNFSEAGIL